MAKQRNDEGIEKKNRLWSMVKTGWKVTEGGEGCRRKSTVTGGTKGEGKGKEWSGKRVWEDGGK
jgi:hypothetical protein